MIEVGKRHSRLLDVVQGNHARSGGWRRRQIAKGAGGASNAAGLADEFAHCDAVAPAVGLRTTNRDKVVHSRTRAGPGCFSGGPISVVGVVLAKQDTELTQNHSGRKAASRNSCAIECASPFGNSLLK